VQAARGFAPQRNGGEGERRGFDDARYFLHAKAAFGKSRKHVLCIAQNYDPFVIPDPGKGASKLLQHVRDVPRSAPFRAAAAQPHGDHAFAPPHDRQRTPRRQLRARLNRVE